MVDISTAVTPTAVVAKFAEAGIKISERKLRDRARKLGAFRRIGNAMFFMPEDVEAILEAAKPEPKSSALVHSLLSPGMDYAKLVELREKQKKDEKRKRDRNP